MRPKQTLRRRLQGDWVCIIGPALEALVNLIPEILTGIVFCILIFGLPAIVLVVSVLF